MAEQLLATQIAARPLLREADFWRVRDLLVATYADTPLGFNWEVRRWDGARFHHATDDWVARSARTVQLWETRAGDLVGVVNPDGEGNAQLQLHPAFRPLEPAMVAWAEAHLASANAEGARQLEIFVFDYDIPRQQLLQSRGYIPMSYGGATRRLRLADHHAAPPGVGAGYRLATTQPAELANCQRVADLLNAAFNRDFHTGIEVQNFTRQAPCFRPELDLVAVAPDGAFAAYVGIAYDEVNRHAVFEPVCTHPQHQRQGLARSLMLEGLQRLKALGAVDVTVDTGDMIPANRLYDSIGFTEVCLGHVWRKEF